MIHPAIKAAARILRKAGIDTIHTGALTLRVCAPEYNERPLYIDVRCSAHDDTSARFEVCQPYQAHTEYARCAVFDKQIFEY